VRSKVPPKSLFSAATPNLQHKPPSLNTSVPFFRFVKHSKVSTKVIYIPVQEPKPISMCLISCTVCCHRAAAPVHVAVLRSQLYCSTRPCAVLQHNCLCLLLYPHPTLTYHAAANYPSVRG
jgi:hypothetical protein